MNRPTYARPVMNFIDMSHNQPKASVYISPQIINNQQRIQPQVLHTNTQNQYYNTTNTSTRTGSCCLGRR